MTGALRAGLIGLGVMGRNHARVLRSLDGVELAGVVDPAGDAHGAAGGAVLHADVERLLATGVDYVVVAAPTASHEEVALQLAEAGVHALVEKPLAPSPAAAARITAAFRERGLIGAVGHIERYNPALQELRRRLEAGALGEVYQIATRRMGPFPSRVADVGVVLDLATHDIDLTAWVASSPYASVSARTAYRSGRANEDLVAAVGTLENGIVTNHLVNWLSPSKERTTLVTGERGAFVADTLTADLTFYANGTSPTQWEQVAAFRGVTEGDVIRYAIAKPEPLVTQHAAFRDAVRSGDCRGVVTLEEGERTVAVATAVVEAARSGRAVAPTAAAAS